MKSLSVIIVFVVAAYAASAAAKKTQAGLNDMIEKRNQAIAAQLAQFE